MRPAMRWVLAVVLGLGLCAGPDRAEAAEPEISVTVAPMRYISVDGDAGTFREHHWMQDGYTGGLSHFSGRHTLANGATLETDGHALIDQNDLGARVALEKEGLGFVDFDFTEFRKYYSGKGGVYRLFGRYSSPDTDKQLELDIGKLELSTGLRLEGFPALTFLYEREYKDGTKSRATWGEAEETVSGTDTTVNIVPSWQEIDEVVDAFELQAEHELAGFALSGEQRWEFVRSENLREELDVSTTHGSGDDKLRRHEQDPETTLMTTFVGAERSFQDGKAFLSTAYRFGHMDNREFETIVEANGLTGVQTNYSNSEQKQNARSDTDYDTHTWVGNVTTQLGESMALITKLKSEVIKRESNSSYPSYADSTPEAYDTVLDRTDMSLADTQGVRWGEGVSFRYTGLPRTALYTELELEQARVLLREDRQSIDGPDDGNDRVAGEVLSRETVTDVRRGTWTLGGRVTPWSVLDLTAQVRHRRNNQDYDDQRETAFSSAFIDSQAINTDEFMLRATYKPVRWLRSSFRYTMRNDDYSLSIQEGAGVSDSLVKSDARSHITTYDLTLQPARDLLMTGSVSRQLSTIETPARYGATTTNIPAFTSNVTTWLFTTDYTFTPGLALTGALQHSLARNFNDFAASGLPYGADYDQVDLTTGLTWSLGDATSVNLEYGFYFYQPNSNWHAGDYGAHLIQFEISKTF